MELLFYANKESHPGEQMHNMTKILFPREAIRFYRTIWSFSRRLRHTITGPVIVVLLVLDRQDFSSLLPVRDLLSQVPIIIILPDREDETIAKAHHLRPRFISYLDSDFTDVALVLEKMIRRVYHTNSLGKKEVSRA